MSNKTYNGWKNWESWNVALWIGNDEVLYLMANDCYEGSNTAEEACEKFVKIINGLGFEMVRSCTQDGAEFNYENCIQYFEHYEGEDNHE